MSLATNTIGNRLASERALIECDLLAMKFGTEKNTQVFS